MKNISDIKRGQNIVPKVSIGLNVYNGGQFIRGALDSLLSQTYVDFELIISDNASTDNTEDICREYSARDARICYIRHLENKGPFFNYKFVLDSAVGEYFMWAAHDDYWFPNFIKELAQILDSRSDIVLAFCKHNQVDLNKKVIRKYDSLYKLEMPITKKLTEKYLIRNSFERFLLAPIFEGKVDLFYGLIRRKSLVDADVIKKWGSFGWGFDILIAATILRYGNVAFSPSILWHKTLNPYSLGSIPPRDKSPTFIESIFGAVDTLIKYLKYVFGIWQVQGTFLGAKKTNIIKRMLFTFYEFFRMVILYLKQILFAFLWRLKIKGKKH
jgi:glycosyltransferase involved in cell wall biosynthesis